MYTLDTESKMTLHKIFKSRFIKDVSTLTIGTTIAQFLPMAIYPILGRLYTPESFAALAAFTSLISVLQVLGSGKYENAILIAKDDTKAANLFCLSNLCCAFLIILIYIVLYFFGTGFTYRYSSGLGELIWLVPLGALLLNVFTCYNEWCVRKQYYKKLAINKITNSVAIAAGKYGTFYTVFQTIGLTLGDFIGRFISAIGCVIRLCIHDKESFSQVSFKGIKGQAKEHVRFPIYTMPAQLMNSVAAASPVFILNYYYSSEVVGYFSMTMSILLLPVNVISYAVRDVFRKKVNDLYLQDGRFDALYRKILFALLALTAIACVLVAPFLPWLFGVVLGSKWFVAGQYSQILLPMIGLDFVAMSLSGVLIVTQKLRQLFLWQLYFCAATIVSLFITSLLGLSITTTLAVFGIARLTAYILLIKISYNYSKGIK